MAIRPVLLLGDRQLNNVSEAVKLNEIQHLGELIEDLHDTLMEYRAKNDAGRAISAPQIGVFKRVIYQNIDGKRTVMINPSFAPLSDEMTECWDECMCFPDLQVRVKRYRYIRVAYMDEEGRAIERELTGELSELFQHEYEHLEGILAIQRAAGTGSYLERDEV